MIPAFIIMSSMAVLVFSIVKCGRSSKSGPNNAAEEKQPDVVAPQGSFTTLAPAKTSSQTTLKAVTQQGSTTTLKKQASEDSLDPMIYQGSDNLPEDEDDSSPEILVRDDDPLPPRPGQMAKVLKRDEMKRRKKGSPATPVRRVTFNAAVNSAPPKKTAKASMSMSVEEMNSVSASSKRVQKSTKSSKSSKSSEKTVLKTRAKDGAVCFVKKSNPSPTE